MSTPQATPRISFVVKVIQHKDDPTGGQMPQEIGIECKGKETFPADWSILGSFIGDGKEPMSQEDLIRMIPIYEKKAYNTPSNQLSKPRKLWIRDDPDLSKQSSSPYQKHGWQPVTVSIEPNERKKHEKWKTKKRALDIEEMETEQCHLWDPRVDYYKPKLVSYFKRTGLPMFKKGTEPPIKFEFRGFPEALGLCCLTKTDKKEEKKTIQWCLYQAGNVSEEDHCVSAIKHTIRGKLNYEVKVSGVAAGDCRERETLMPFYRQFPVDFVLQHNDIESTTVMFEEIELVYYTNIKVSHVDEVEIGSSDYISY
eukprot:Nitzschia sp. Nitz4//scaffold205_size38804//32867//33799//NITZ4_007650-RA/size38804-processed-gene-0.21-mRNA-1//-1//CDS//3329541531//6975//frame0